MTLFNFMISDHLLIDIDLLPGRLRFDVGDKNKKGKAGPPCSALLAGSRRQERGYSEYVPHSW